MKYIPFILFTVLANAAAQLILKHGLTMMGPLTFAGANPIMKVVGVIFHPWVFAGLSVYVLSMACHLYVLSKVEVSFVYPFLSLPVVVIAVFAYFVFHEHLNGFRIAGIAFICIGTVLVSQSGGTESSPSSRTDKFQVSGPGG